MKGGELPPSRYVSMTLSDLTLPHCISLECTGIQVMHIEWDRTTELRRIEGYAAKDSEDSSEYEGIAHSMNGKSMQEKNCCQEVGSRHIHCYIP